MESSDVESCYSFCFCLIKGGVMEKDHGTLKTIVLIVLGFGLLAGLVGAIRKFSLTADK